MYGANLDHSQLYTQLLVSATLFASTTFVHGLFVASVAAIFRSAKIESRGVLRFFRDSIGLALIVLWLMFAHIIEMLMWAATYLHFNLFDNVETALYFSAASYTTLGFGDILLPDSWRLLSGATAANGLLLFGLSAAFLFYAVGKLHLAGKINN